MTTYRQLLHEPALPVEMLSSLEVSEKQYAHDWLAIRQVRHAPIIAPFYATNHSNGQSYGGNVNSSIYRWYLAQLNRARRELNVSPHTIDDLSYEIEQLKLDEIAPRPANKEVLTLVARVNDLDLLLRLRPYTGVRLNMVEYAAMVVTGKFDVLVHDAQFASPNQLKRAMVNALESVPVCHRPTKQQHEYICKLRRDMILFLSQYTPISLDAPLLLARAGDLQTIADLSDLGYI